MVFEVDKLKRFNLASRLTLDYETEMVRCSPISSNLDSTLTSCSRLCSSRHINLHCLMSFYPRALSFFPHFRHSGLLLSPMSVSVFFLPTIYGFSSFYRHRLTFYDWYPPSLLWLILWLIWRLGLSACWNHRGTRARVLGLPPPFRPLVLVLGFLSDHVP